MKILLAVDGSKPSQEAVALVIRTFGELRSKPEVELVTVHLPVPRLPRMGMAVSKQQLGKYYEEEGETKLAAAKRRLDAAGIRYKASILVGPVAETIVKHANGSRCNLICMGSRGMGAIGKALIGSVASRVLQLASQPLLIAK